MRAESLSEVQAQAVALLQSLIAIPSFSREEGPAADFLEGWLTERGLAPQRRGHNVLVEGKQPERLRWRVLLNSHLDTVKPNPAYTRDPWAPTMEKGKLYGLGSNDAGGALVALVAALVYFQKHPLAHIQLCLAATAEEEISGAGGIESVLAHLGALDMAIVGEPTSGQMAVAEKGLMVVDAVVKGQAGHAAREEGVNSLYLALDDLLWIRSHTWEPVSALLGPTKCTATVISAGSQHNVVPAECAYTLDIRLNEYHSHEQVLNTLSQHLKAELKPRSQRLRSSRLEPQHPLYQAGLALGLPTYGSPTMSDMALLRGLPALKLGPGDSARSHSADEFIFLNQIHEGVALYIRLLEQLDLLAAQEWESSPSVSPS